MGRDIYGCNPGSTANGDAGSRPCMYGLLPPTSQNEASEVRAEDDDRDRRLDAISCAADDALRRPTHVWAGWLRSASPHSSGRAYVEVHRALAAICLLTACRIAGRLSGIIKPPTGAFLFPLTPLLDDYHPRY